MFIKWIISFEDSPIDSAAADIVSFVPVLYPAYQFVFNYNAKWSATSIWEHKESYTEYESKTFYVDKRGREHNYRGYDKDSAGNDVFFTPIVKQVPTTKTRTVIDKTQRTNGKTDGQKTSSLYALTGNSSFNKWLQSFDGSSSLPIASDSVEDFRIEEPCEDETSALNIAYEDLKNTVSQKCKGQVQGTRFTGFSVDDLHETHATEVTLLPVYRLTYRYNKKDYMVLFSGVSQNEVFFEERPIMQEYEQFISQSKAKIREDNSRITNNTCYILLIVCGILFVIIPLLFMLFTLRGKIRLLLLPIIIVASVAAFWGVKFYSDRIEKYKAEKTMHENQMKEYTQDIARKRNEIAAVIQNTSLSYEEKKEQVNQILSQ